jgi:hypothetical protein
MDFLSKGKAAMESMTNVAEFRGGCRMEFRKTAGVERGALKLGGLGQSLFEALENCCGQADNSNAGILFRLGVNRNTVRVGEWIRNHLKFLAVQADALAGSVAKTFHVGAKFTDRNSFGMMAGHDNSIVPRCNEPLQPQPR